MKKLLYPFVLFFVVSFLVATGGQSASFKYGGIKLDETVLTTAGTTTTLTASSTQVYYASGSSVQSIVLPSAVSLTNGYWYKVINGTASATVTVKDNNTGVLKQLPASSSATFFLINSTFPRGEWAIDSGAEMAGMINISALDIDWSLGNVFTKNISSGTTFTFSNVPIGKTIVVRVFDTNTSTVTWPATIRWVSGTAPTQTTAKTDVYTFVSFGPSEIYGSVVQGF